MGLVEILDDCHALEEWGAVGKDQSGYTLDIGMITLLGLSLAYDSVLCSPFSK